MNRSIIVLALMLNCLLTIAQDKWGQIDLKVFQNKSCPFDTGAPAMVLFDKSEISVTYENGGLYIIYDVHMRIQLFRKEGFEEANISIPYHAYHNAEHIANMEAHTLNIENGTLVKSKVPEKSFYDKQITDVISAENFSFPEVREGSVIEYRYTLRSRLLGQLRPFVPQSGIPSLLAKWSLKAPTFLTYSAVPQTQGLALNKKQEDCSIQFTKAVYGGGDNGIGMIPAVEMVYEMKNIPALKSEKFITTMSDYRARVSFILARLSIPNQRLHMLANNWNDVAKPLLEAEDFGMRLGGMGNHIKFAKDIAEKLSSPVERLKAIYYNIKGHVNWNKYYSVYARKSLRDVYDGGSGNSAEVNLLLVDMLRAAKIAADPVLISTRSNGKIKTRYPDMGDFDHVIVVAEIDSQKIFMDATAKQLAYNSLALEDLNAEGLRIAKPNCEWLQINAAKGSGTLISTTINVDSMGGEAGKIKFIAKDYCAQNCREQLIGMEIKDYVEENLKKAENIEVADIATEDKDSVEKRLKLSFSYAKPAKDDGEDLKAYYIHPFPVVLNKDNPLKAKDRSFPVSFGYAYDETYKTNIFLPPNLKLAELPKPLNIKLPDGTASYLLQYTASDNLVQASSTFKINKEEFTAEEYANLKEIFSQMVDGINSVIVLEKK